MQILTIYGDCLQFVDLNIHIPLVHVYVLMFIQ